MINTIIKFFSPKNQFFFDNFRQAANITLEMSNVLIDLVQQENIEKRMQLTQRIKDLEGENDKRTHNTFILLGKNFITPFDREDIHALASSIDDIADYIYAASKKIKLYKFNPNTDAIIKFSQLAHESVKEVHKAIHSLTEKKINEKMITNSIIRINSIENDADDLLDYNIEKLFDIESSSIEIIKKKEIFQVFELITDKCEDAGNVIESIVIKYM